MQKYAVMAAQSAGCNTPIRRTPFAVRRPACPENGEAYTGGPYSEGHGGFELDDVHVGLRA
jgi:hypothetical protein